MPEPLRRSVLSDDVYDSLRSMVLEHQLAPEERVNIDALARSLDVSPTPVREALARLESDGLVRKRPLAGYTVAPLLTRGEFTDMFDMRLVLETAAARWAAGRATAAARVSLSEEASRSYVVSTSHEAFTAADARFHDLVASAAGNPLLREAIGRLHAHLHIHRLYFPYAQTGSTRLEHERIAAAIEAGEPDAAEAAMRAHLDAAQARHLAVFDQF
ncbi:GntR family transcriptional regulator [Actinoplanes sp. NPDC020271]|uniref:GntR family transcriptional regulator n=1 Tax=Actinoplanes sp. NPDC020271 TaxID=3363896 RepID=UPI00378BED71